MRISQIVNVIILAVFTSVQAEAETSDVQHEESLKLQLNRTEGPKKLVILDKLTNLYWGVPAESYWLFQLYHEAMKLDSLDIADDALGSLSRYYHNTDHPDSLQMIVKMADAITKRAGHLTDGYFVAHAFWGKYNLWHLDHEKSVEEASSLYKSAVKNNSKDGIICSAELLTLIYQTMHRDSTAIPYIKQAISLLRKQNEPSSYRNIAQDLTILSELNLITGQLPEAEKSIHDFLAIVEEVESGKYGETSFPTERCRRLAACYYAEYYTRKGDTKSALTELNKAATFKQTDVYVDFYYDWVSALYYRKVHDYQSSLKHIDNFLFADYEYANIPYMIFRAELLSLMGRDKEAAKQYQDALKFSENANNNAFNNSLSELQTLHDLNRIVVQQKEIQIKNIQLNSNRKQMKMMISMSLILLIAFLFILKLYLHASKLKKELQKEKLSLEESEEKLKIAYDKAEAENQQKTIFLANMSHDIRTPLNAISGFSNLLTESITPDEDQEEYIRLINENSDLLLNLVNDVLDLTRLESNRYNFVFHPCELTQLCKDTMSSMENRVKEGVKLTFSSTPSTFTLNTDRLRLQQVLMNLLGNSSKYTSQGFIHLEYQLDEPNHRVLFVVTDSGTGVPKEKQDLIFERFEKANEFIHGTGLGLSICRLISTRFNGSIYLDKEYTKGARFVFIHSTDCE